MSPNAHLQNEAMIEDAKPQLRPPAMIQTSLSTETLILHDLPVLAKLVPKQDGMASPELASPKSISLTMTPVRIICDQLWVFWLLGATFLQLSMPESLVTDFFVLILLGLLAVCTF